MTKRTPGLELVDTIIPKSIHELGPKVEKLYRRYFVLWHWKDIVGEAIASNVKPMGIEHEKLWLYSADSSWRNEIQMMQTEILRKVNRYAGEKLVAEMQFCRKWDNVPSYDLEEKRTQQPKEFHLGRTIQKVNLTEEEIKKAASDCFAIEDDELRDKMQRFMLNHQKMTKFKETHQWHKCMDCDALCPEGKVRCSACARRHASEIRGKVRSILQELPWLRYGEIKKQVPECTPYMVNSQRASMVQVIARRVELKDFRKLEAKRLVMLHLCLPPEQLTEDIVKRTLYRLRTDLAVPKEFKPVKRYDYLGKGTKKKKKWD
ncbi:MAG: DUF721 domain-containing protein [Selenomonadaceae bacterium]|nr:DUF721 domain-containing protein [Selenomonadaceae bacterium]MBR4695054.1 DUF721 domain-containing protein [Selenomonadaceae bacterium]